MRTEITNWQSTIPDSLIGQTSKRGDRLQSWTGSSRLGFILILLVINGRKSRASRVPYRHCSPATRKNIVDYRGPTNSTKTAKMDIPAQRSRTERNA